MLCAVLMNLIFIESLFTIKSVHFNSDRSSISPYVKAISGFVSVKLQCRNTQIAIASLQKIYIARRYSNRQLAYSTCLIKNKFEHVWKGGGGPHVGGGQGSGALYRGTGPCMVRCPH